MENNSLEKLVRLVSSYEITRNLVFENNFEKELRHRNYDVIYINSGDLFFAKGGKEFYGTLKKVVDDSMADVTYPQEKSEILARLYFFGCECLYSSSLSSNELDDFCTKYINVLKKWSVDVINEIYEETKNREEMARNFGEHHNIISLNEKLKITQDILKDFFEYVNSKNTSLVGNYKKGVIKISNSNNIILLKHYNLSLF